jgi:hypothetical protein
VFSTLCQWAHSQRHLPLRARACSPAPQGPSYSYSPPAAAAELSRELKLLLLAKDSSVSKGFYRTNKQPTALQVPRFPMWAPKAVADGDSDGEGRDAHHTVVDTFELQTGPTWQQLARNSASTFIAKLDGQGMGVAAAAMNDTFSRDLWSQSVFVEAFIMKGGLPLMCRLASAASDDALFYQYDPAHPFLFCPGCSSFNFAGVFKCSRSFVEAATLCPFANTAEFA